MSHSSNMSVLKLISTSRTLKNPNVSDEAKQNAEQKLQDMGAK